MDVSPRGISSSQDTTYQLHRNGAYVSPHRESRKLLLPTESAFDFESHPTRPANRHAEERRGLGLKTHSILQETRSSRVPAHQIPAAPEEIERECGQMPLDGKAALPRQSPVARAIVRAESSVVSPYTPPKAT